MKFFLIIKVNVVKNMSMELIRNINVIDLYRGIKILRLNWNIGYVNL